MSNIVAELVQRHEGQYWGDYPYLTHLERVARIACHIKNTKNINDLAFLHDVIEDTETDLNEIPIDIREDVYFLTRSLSGVRKTYTEYINNIIENGSENTHIVKLADSIVNYGLCRETKTSSLLDRYRKNIEKLYPVVFHTKVQWGLVDTLVDAF